MGGIAVLEACVMPFLGALIFNKTYSATVSSLPGAFLLVAAGVYVVTAAIMLGFAIHLSRRTPEQRPLLSSAEKSVNAD